MLSRAGRVTGRLSARLGGPLSSGPGGDRRVEMRIRCKGEAMTLIRLQTVRYSLLRP